MGFTKKVAKKAAPAKKPIFVEKKVGGAKNGETRMVRVKKLANDYPTQDAAPKGTSVNFFSKHVRRVRASLASGAIAIVLAGVHKGKIGDMTCVLKEMNCLNAENEIDVRAMKKDSGQYNMPSVWFKNRYEEILDTCYEVATNLPEKLNKQEIISGEFGTVNMGQIKSFMSCCKNAKQKLCMNQDIKNKIESNFGPVDEILESFNYQITEDQLFTQVNQLLQGSEDEYM